MNEPKWKREWPDVPGYWWVWRPGDDRVYMRIVPQSAIGKKGASPYFFAKVDRPDPPDTAAEEEKRAAQEGRDASRRARWGG